LKSCRVLQDHYDDERNKTVFQNTTPDQDHSVQDQERFFGLRPTVSDHIAGRPPSFAYAYVINFIV